MATELFSTTRRTLLGAAVSLPIAALPAAAVASTAEQHTPARTLWNRRLATYRRLAARKKEAAETGFYRQANDRYEREQAALAHRFGSWQAARASEAGRPLCRAAFAQVDAAEQAFYDRCTAPMKRAAVRLAVTPAPDVEALLTKIRVMQEQQLDELDCMKRPVLEVLARDVRPLIKREEPRPTGELALLVDSMQQNRQKCCRHKFSIGRTRMARSNRIRLLAYAWLVLRPLRESIDSQNGRSKPRIDIVPFAGMAFGMEQRTDGQAA